MPCRSSRPHSSRAATRPGSLASCSTSCAGQFLAGCGARWAPRGRATARPPPRPTAQAPPGACCSGRPAASGRWRCSEPPSWRCATRSTPASLSRLQSSALPIQKSMTMLGALLERIERLERRVQDPDGARWSHADAAHGTPFAPPAAAGSDAERPAALRLAKTWCLDPSYMPPPRPLRWRVNPSRTGPVPHPSRRSVPLPPATSRSRSMQAGASRPPQVAAPSASPPGVGQLDRRTARECLASANPGRVGRGLG